MKSFSSLPVFFLVALAGEVSGQRPTTVTSSSPTLVRMRARIDSATLRRPFDFQRQQALSDSLRPVLFSLIERDSLRTAIDFSTASSLVFDPTGFFENRRVEHEMALAAFVLGHPGGLERVASTWDALNMSMGLGQRIGTHTRDGVPMDMDRVPAPRVVGAIFRDVRSARKRAEGAVNNPELQALRDADQADRAGPPNPQKIALVTAADARRRARVVALIAAGVPATGRDMQNAATVLQHGRTPGDYRLAHELSIAAFALGDTAARWLISRSYDRLLLRMGHRQRLATQFRGVTLQPIDTVGTSDRVRALLGGRPLADVRTWRRP